MIPPQPPVNEEERLAELLRYEILDTEAEADFDEIVKLAAYLCKAEIALITLLDDHRQWFKAKKGIDVTETPRNLSFCGHAIREDCLFEIPDALLDERFWDNPLVIGKPNIRFYAGQPIKSVHGYNLGTLCVIDSQPRSLTKNQKLILAILAKQVERQLELRLRLRELEESFRLISEQKKALENLNQMKDQTLSVLTHDLRNPLSSLGNLLELFDDQILEAEEAVDLIKDVKPNIEQVNRQLEDVLYWAKEQMRGRNVQWESIPVGAIAYNCFHWIGEGAKLKGVQLSQEFDKDLKVLGDQNLIEIVLRNFLNNAIKFTRQGDKITLFAKLEDNQVRLGVKDTGLGISQESIDKILTYNYNSTIGTAREIGTGLGLMLCQTFLNQMNTKLIIEKIYPEGCSFSFLLPQCS